LAIVEVEELLAYGDLREERVNGPMVEGLLRAAERFLQRYARRTFDPQPALAANGTDTNSPIAKTFVVARGTNLIRVPDLRATTTVALDGLALNTSTGYYPLDTAYEPATTVQLYEPYGLQTGWSNPSGPGQLTITGRWGWNPVPDDVKYAVMALTVRLYKERNANWADSVALPDGSVLQYFRSLPATVQAAIGLYRPLNLAIASMG